MLTSPALAARGRSLGGPLSGKAQRELQARSRPDAGKGRPPIQQFLRVRRRQAISTAAQALKTRPWTIKIDGMVEKPREIGIDDLLKAVQLEERLYRLRCVEAWSMTIPWTGFPIKALVDIAKPLASAKYVRWRRSSIPRSRRARTRSGIPGPISMADHGGGDERTVVHGHWRLWQAAGQAVRRADPPHQPWKYGFKAVKSIKRITFTDQAAEKLLGSAAGRPNMASGPM